MMNREQAETLLAVLVADELDEPVRGELLAYLKTDPELADRVGDMRAAAGLVRAGLEQEAVDTPASLGDERRGALLALAEREPITASPAVSAGPSSSTGTSVLFSFRAAGAAAACVAMGVGLIGLALPELGVARRSARRMMNAPMSPQASEAPEYAYDSADDVSEHRDYSFRSDSLVFMAQGAQTAPADQSMRGDRAVDRAIDSVLQETAGTLAEDIAPGSLDFFDSAAPAAQTPRTSDVLANARATNDRISRDASGLLGAEGLGFADGQNKPDDGWVGSVVWNDNHTAGESPQDFDARYHLAEGDAEGHGYQYQSGLTPGYLSAQDENLEGLNAGGETTRVLVDESSSPQAPPDPAELDRWASANGVALGLPARNTPQIAPPANEPGFNDRRARLRFVDRGEAEQEELLYPGLADAPDAFDINGLPPDMLGGLGPGGEGRPDNGSNWDPVTVTGNSAPPSLGSAPDFDLNEALSNTNRGGSNAAGGGFGGGRGGRADQEGQEQDGDGGGGGGGGGGGLFGDSTAQAPEQDPMSFGIDLPFDEERSSVDRPTTETPDATRRPTNDLLTQARRQLAADKLAEAEEAARSGQQHLARELYEEAQLLAPDNLGPGQRLAELNERITNGLRPADPLTHSAADITIARQESAARYERAMQRAQEAQANGEFDAAMDAVIQARTLLNANRSAFSQAEQNELVGRAARMQSGINDARAMDEARQARFAERQQSERESTARREAEGRRVEQVQERLQNARALQTDRDYDAALDELDAALFIDPHNEAALAMRELLQDVQVGAESVRLRRQLDLMRSNQQLINDEAVIPYDELLTYPGEWPELTQLRLAGLDDENGESEANRTAGRALRHIVTVDFENATLREAIEYLRDSTGVNLAMNWPALDLSGVTPDSPVSLSLARAPAELVLKLILEQAGSESYDDDKPGYTIVEGIVQVSTLADLKTATEVGLYDIRALFEHIPAEERQDHIAELMQLIQDTVGNRNEWLDEESTIRELNGNLIVKTTDENHRALVTLIGRLGYEAQQTEEDPAAERTVPPVNPWVLTAHDAQSTFALDTDTASYELARRTITEQAQLPAIASVRMEEFVNRFDYQYPAGRGAHDTFTVHAEAGDAPFAEDGVLLVKVGVRGRVVSRDQMKPAHYVFVIDASGSMAREDRLPLVQQSLAMLLGQLGERDTVSLVSYDTRPFLLLEHAPARGSGGETRAILDAAATIQTGGSTNLSDGLRLGYQVAARHFAPGAVNRVILCSDGVANVGDHDAQQMLDAAESLRRQGVTLMTVGVGVDGQSAAAQAQGDERFNDGLLEQLANRGDGRYVYLGSVEDAQRQLVEDLAATRPTIAYDAKIQVVFDPARVRRYRLIGYENRDIADQDFRNDAVDAGEVGSGQSATALYEVELYPAVRNANRGGDRGQMELGTVFVRYRDAETNAVRETETPLSSGIIQERTVRDDPRFYLAACAAEFAELLRESEHAKDGSLARLHRLARQVAEALPLDRDAAELADLIGRSSGLPRAGQ